MATIKLIGAPQSPYSRKMRSALRYRRIPYQWIRAGAKESQNVPEVKIPGMVPVLWFAYDNPATDRAMLDSTFQLKHLEELYSQRSLLPNDPVVRFFAELLEDFADEWLTKCMFHYRWYYSPDIEKAGTILPLELKWDQTDEQVQPLQAMFSKRQTERLEVVGSNATTKPVIEQSYRQILQALNSILTRQPFLLGHRASAADFAFMGQLACLTNFEQTSERVTLTVAPRVYAWVESVEDLSGEAVEANAWAPRETMLDLLSPLLDIIGTTYVPFLLANASALNNGAEMVECEINGATWQQKPFRYQGKCLRWLQEAFANLNEADQDFTKEILSASGCNALVDTD